MAGTYDLTVEQGATFRLTIKVSSESGLLDMTGFDGKMQIRDYVEDPTITIDMTPANGRLTFRNGYVDLYIPADLTETFTKDGVYDLEFTDLGGDTSRLLQGKAILDREVTRG